MVLDWKWRSSRSSQVDLAFSFLFFFEQWESTQSCSGKGKPDDKTGQHNLGQNLILCLMSLYLRSSHTAQVPKWNGTWLSHVLISWVGGWSGQGAAQWVTAGLMLLNVMLLLCIAFWMAARARGWVRKPVYLALFLLLSWTHATGLAHALFTTGQASGGHSSLFSLSPSWDW